jgi:2-dehydro-3-deoxy-D-arabinonate dehydratase
MRYFTHDDRLLAVDADAAYDLTATDDALHSFPALARAAHDAGQSLDAYVADTLDTLAPADGIPDTPSLPVEPPEVWASGVTYEISEQAREAESGLPEVYLNAYSADRPEIFFKATPSRTVGPGEAVGIRADSTWDVPEPELAIVVHRGDIVGYTVGNDMSSRSIEGDNPLYLPQAKVYDRCCSIGPCIASPDTVGDPHDLAMSLTIERDGATVFADETTTADMVRTCEELVGYLARHNPLPETTVLLTGTGIVPDQDFTLQEGDHVAIDIEAIGTLENPVVTV